MLKQGIHAEAELHRTHFKIDFMIISEIIKKTYVECSGLNISRNKVKFGSHNIKSVIAQPKTTGSAPDLFFSKFISFCCIIQ